MFVVATSCGGGHAVPDASTDVATDAPADDAPADVGIDASTLMCARSACQTGAVDTDGDDLPDAWEQNQFIDVNCNGTLDASEPLLPGASPTVSDIYVTYDFMGYGRDDELCTTAASCTALGVYHAGETCNAAGQCQFTCSQDSDCTGRSGASHAAERCRLFTDGTACTDSPGTPTGACACYHTHDPEAIAPGALQKVIDAFDLHGVHLHIARGKEQPHSHVVSYRETAAFDLQCEGGSVAAGNAGVGKYAVALADLKTIASGAESVMHYALFAHYVGCDSASHCPANPGNTSTCTTPFFSFAQSGYAELSGNDLVVSLGGLIDNSGLAPGIVSAAGFSQVGATFMHELGHNLGIRHDGHVDVACPSGSGCPATETCIDLGDGQGLVCHESFRGVVGAEEPNYKPNYVSIMNYRYQKSGIQSSSTRNVAAAGTAPTAGAATMDPTLTRLDYSNQVLATLTEDNLDDASGLGWTPDPLYPGAYLLFSYVDGTCHSCPQIAAAEGSVDWTCANCATNPSCQLVGSGPSVFDATAVSADVDAAAGVCEAAPTDVLHGARDWGNFKYAFACTPAGAK